jgi:hypothetical protein
MTTIKLEAKKAQLAKEILIEENESIIDKVMTYLMNMKKDTVSPPCQYSTDELLSRVEESVAQYERGESYSQEEVFEEIDKKFFKQSAIG